MPNMSPKKNEMPSQPADVRNKNFLEVALGYTEEQAIDEAKRCLNCKNKPCVNGCPVKKYTFPRLFRRLPRATLRAHMKLFRSKARCRLFAVVYARRKRNANQNAFAESRASLSVSADLSALSPIIIMQIARISRKPPNQTVIRLL